MSVKTAGNCRQTGVALTVVELAAMATKSEVATKGEYYNLTDYLFDGYKKDIRPVIFDSDITYVYIAFYLYSIVNVNEQHQTLKTNPLLEIQWTDTYLSWEESEYSNIGSILATQSSVWLPDIVVGNTVTSQTQLDYNNLKVLLNMKGEFVTQNDFLWVELPAFVQWLDASLMDETSS